MMTSDCAAASIPMMDTCWMISDRLKAEKKFFATSPKTASEIISTITGTMVG